MAVLTISRQMGSDGAKIAHETARALGYKLADKELLAHILGEYGLVEFSSEYEGVIGFWDYFDKRMNSLVAVLNKAILAIGAVDDVVIVGRGAFALFRGYEDVVNARLQAPFSVRVKRVAERDGIEDFVKAAELVKRGDKARGSFIEKVYGLGWNEADAFDLVLDTNVIGAETAVSWLAEAVEGARKRPKAGGPRVSDLVVDPVMADAVRSAFAAVAGGQAPSSAGG
jgi:cytidylate kinase